MCIIPCVWSCIPALSGIVLHCTIFVTIGYELFHFVGCITLYTCSLELINLYNYISYTFFSNKFRRWCVLPPLWLLHLKCLAMQSVWMCIVFSTNNSVHSHIFFITVCWHKHNHMLHRFLQSNNSHKLLAERKGWGKYCSRDPVIMYYSSRHYFEKK